MCSLVRTKGMSSDEITAVAAAWQAGAISRETMFDLSRRGEVLPAGGTDEEECRLAEKPKTETLTSPATDGLRSAATYSWPSSRLGGGAITR